MAALNEVLADRVVDHAIDLERYSNGVVRRMIAILNRADASLSARLAEALLQVDPSTFTVERLEVILASVRELNRAAYAQVFPELEAEIQALAKVEAGFDSGLLRATVPAVVQVQFPIAGIAWEQVYAAAMSRPFQGRLLSGWASAVEAGRMNLIRNTIRQGFVEGLTTADIVRKIKGTKALKYEDGILNRARHELQTVVRTALSHTAATARQLSYEANADLLKAEAWLSTLDSKTSQMCRVRDGLQYTPVDHKPIGHKIPWGAGPGRLHFGCRSTSTPVTKSWRELGFDMDELPATTRASMDGQVPADMTYAQWFAKQSAARQDEIVGPARGKLYRAGKITFEGFSNDKGQFLTLSQLESRIAA